MNWERIGAILDQPATLWDCILFAFIALAISMVLNGIAE